MAKKRKDKEKERELKRREWQRYDDAFRGFQKQAPHYIRLLKLRGHSFPFHDYIEPYEPEFHKIVAEARARYPSLVGIFEVDGAVLGSNAYEQFGCSPSWTHVKFNCDDPLIEQYGQGAVESNIRGTTTAFLDEVGELRTLVLIQQQVHGFPHRDLKYMAKVSGLLHELGHVGDMEQQINFRYREQTADLISAEVYAHVFALNELVRRHYRNAFQAFEPALQRNCGKPTLQGNICDRVFQEFKGECPPCWRERLGSSTEEDAKALGAIGMLALRNE